MNLREFIEARTPKIPELTLQKEHRIAEIRPGQFCIQTLVELPDYKHVTKTHWFWGKSEQSVPVVNKHWITWGRPTVKIFATFEEAKAHLDNELRIKAEYPKYYPI